MRNRFQIPTKSYFIGFNAISSAEEGYLLKIKYGDFYWDYNSDFVQDKK